MLPPRLRRLQAAGWVPVRPPSVQWVQSLADCTGLPVDVVAVPEGGALGAAFQARLAVGLETQMSDGARWARTARRVEPDPAWASACAGRYERFRELVG